MSKKWMNLVTLLLILGVMLAACGSTPEPEAPVAVPAVPTATAPEPSGSRIESAVEENRRGVNKVLQRDVLETIRVIQENGIFVLGNFMFGLPRDNYDSMQATLDLAIQSQCEFANFYSTVAYPGSALYDHWMEREPEVISTDWRTFSQHSYEALPLPTEYLAPKEVLAFRDNAFNTYFSNHDYLDMIGRKFGSRAVQHIEKMLEVKLERKLFNN